MKKRIAIIIFAVAGLYHAEVQGQQPVVNNSIEAVIESIIEEIDEETDISLMIEDLESLAEKPLNINMATAEDLGRLHLLDEVQIEKIIEYRTLYGPVYSIFELNAVDGLHPDILTKMEPFIHFGPVDEKKPGLAETLNYGRHEMLFRSIGTVQKAKGYIADDDGKVPFEGNRYRYYSRYRFTSGDNVSAGITAEKDPGEGFLSQSNHYGFDFYSGHLSFRLNKVISRIIVGDYVVRSGQGLVIWQGFSAGKSFYTQNIVKTNQGIRPYTSTDENMFFRGGSASLQMGKASLHLFCSRKNMDANIAGSDSSGWHFTSIQTSGLHRTPGEIEDRKSVTDLNTGGIMNWRTGNLRIGTTFLYRQFSMPYQPATQLYNLFYFRGRENYAASADYLYNRGKYRLFGEVAVSKSGGTAILHGLTAWLHDQFQLSLLYRNFARDYHALWASPFAEGSAAANESGLYAGVRLLPVRFVTVSSYADIYRSRWMKYTTAAPSGGYDFFVQGDFNFSRRFQFYIRYKNEEKERKFLMDEKYQNLPEIVRKSRLHIQFKPSEPVTLKTRIEYIYYNGLKTEHGLLVFQDLQIAPQKFPATFSARVAWFNTEGYYSRVYAYENDLLYTFAVPALYGEGIRTYLNLKVKLVNNIDVWMKLAESLYLGSESVGSGYNEIQGNHKTEVKFQLRVKF